jgi:hypothetical protein
MRQWLIGIGLALVAIGLLWPVIVRLGLGRLPGDLTIDRPGLHIYVPITTSILISLLLSLVLWWLRK